MFAWKIIVRKNHLARRNINHRHWNIKGNSDWAKKSITLHWCKKNWSYLSINVEFGNDNLSLLKRETLIKF